MNATQLNRLIQQVRAVRRLFAQADSEIAIFKKAQGISCPAGCAECCKKEDIEATVLEFLPLAYVFYKKGSIYDIIDKLEHDSGNALCPFLERPAREHSTGSCMVYHDRGMICRLFGFAATTDKHDRPHLASCRVIKNNYHSDYIRVYNDVLVSGGVPLFKNYYMSLYSIEPSLSTEYHPIRLAALKAMEYIAFYYSCRDRCA